MKKTRIVKTAEVTIETEERTVFRGGQNQFSTFLWCPACGRKVEMITPEQAARLAGVPTRTMYDWGESGKAHFSQTPERVLLVCLASIRGTGSMPG